MWGGAGQIEGLEEVRRNSTQITIPICALFEPNSCFYWGLDARLTCLLNYKVLLLGRIGRPSQAFPLKNDVSAFQRTPLKPFKRPIKDAARQHKGC